MSRLLEEIIIKHIIYITIIIYLIAVNGVSERVGRNLCKQEINIVMAGHNGVFCDDYIGTHGNGRVLVFKRLESIQGDMP